VPTLATQPVDKGRRGVAVAKDFGPKHGGVFYGRVTETFVENGRKLHHVEWEDQDEEDLDDEECDAAEYLYFEWHTRVETGTRVQKVGGKWVFPAQRTEPPPVAANMAPLFTQNRRRKLVAPKATPRADSGMPMGITLPSSTLLWLWKTHGMMAQEIDGDGYCGYRTAATLEGLSLRQVVVAMHTAVATYNQELVELRCGGRHCSLLKDSFGHYSFGPDQLKKRATRYGKVLQEIDAGRRWLKDDLWFELDDAKVLSVVFDSPYMMLINQKEYPIRLYDGADICAFKSTEDYESKRPGIQVTKGFGYSTGHFNALVTSPLAPPDVNPVFASVVPAKRQKKTTTAGSKKKRKR
jgi:hypothetical protein